MRQRVKVNLRTRWVQVFDHSAEQQLLCFKEKFVPSEHPRLGEMRAFSAKLRKLGIGESAGFGLTKEEFARILDRWGLNENLNKKRMRHSPACANVSTDDEEQDKAIAKPVATSNP